jgi:hypothetical protein
MFNHELGNHLNSSDSVQEETFALLDEFLRARAAAGITQSEVAERIGTTQSAIAAPGIRYWKALAINVHLTEVCTCPWLSPGVEIDH